MTITLEAEHKDHDKVVLTNLGGDTYTSKSEELIDFLHGADKPRVVNRLQLFIGMLNHDQCQLIEKAILEIANHGETDITFPIEMNIVADKILNY